jgi:Xaa-Pro aminopeptidase
MIATDRTRKLRDAMAQAQLDVLVVYGNAWQGDYLRYAADYGVLEGQALAVVRRDGEVTLYLDSPLEAERAAIEAPGLTVICAPDILVKVEQAMEHAGNARIGTAPRTLLPRRLAARQQDLRLSDETALIDRLLMNKLACEVDAVRNAARLADEGYEVFRRAARPGRADYELVAEVEAFYRARGVDDNFMIIGVGGPEVRGMAPPSGKRLKPGDLVTTELTPCVDGYYGQICRTLVLGEPSAEQRAAFDIYLEALEAGIATVRAGVTAAAVAKAENDVFRKHGLGIYVTNEYTRVRGHGLGLFADSKPHILEDVETRLEAGMTIIVHPNTYHPVVGYMVLGDIVAVTPEGHELFTRTPRALFDVPLE